MDKNNHVYIIFFGIINEYIKNFTNNIILTSTKVFEIQHRCESTRANDGFGLATGFGGTEVYTIVAISRIE